MIAPDIKMRKQTPPPEDTRSGIRSGRFDTRWLSRDLAELAVEWKLHLDDAQRLPGDDVDVLIIGSGYGGAMALHELAGTTIDGQPLTIAMLERGNEYLPGAFPTRFSELGGHVRFHVRGEDDARGEPTGLFDARIGGDVSCLLGSGLGGGSLINAGVMEAPRPEVFQDPRWPEDIRSDTSLGTQAKDVQALLGAVSQPPQDRRATVMDALGEQLKSKPVMATVAIADDLDRGVSACIACGDCTVGCNHRAKLSLDATLLADACRKHPAKALRVVTGATVLALEKRSDGGYVIEAWHTDRALRRRQLRPFRLRARRVIVSAGTFGSTELLMRAQKSGLALSDRLGRQFSANGDDIAAIQGLDVATGAVADEDVPFPHRQVGPTITRMIDARDDATAPRVIQDLALSAPLRRIFGEFLAATSLLASLDSSDLTVHGELDELDPAGLDPRNIERSMLVAIIGQDSADGRLELKATSPDSDGTVSVVWPEAAAADTMAQRHLAFEASLARVYPDATPLANPVWQPLPRALERFVGTTRGGVISVHPLGGCAMGDDATTGVVDAVGRVFDGNVGSRVHDGLVILDGSIVPTSLGINPSLTIAMLARRAVRALLSEWGIVSATDSDLGALSPRPTFRIVPQPVEEASTRVEITEQMTAPAHIDLAGKRADCDVEVQLRFRAVDVSRLISPGGPRVLEVDPARSVFRIYRKPPAEPPAESLTIDADSGPLPASSRTLVLQAPLQGRT